MQFYNNYAVCTNAAIRSKLRLYQRLIKTDESGQIEYRVT